MTGLARKIIKGSAKVDQKKQEIKTLLSILDSVVPEEKWRNMADEEALHSFLVGRIPHYWKIVKFANGVGFKVCYHLPKQGEVCIFSSYAPDKISLNAETTPTVHAGLDVLVASMMEYFDLKDALDLLLQAGK